MKPLEALVASALIACALFVVEVRTGALRSEGGYRGERATNRLGSREFPDHGLSGKV